MRLFHHSWPTCKYDTKPIKEKAKRDTRQIDKALYKIDREEMPRERGGGTMRFETQGHIYKARKNQEKKEKKSRKECCKIN